MNKYKIVGLIIMLASAVLVIWTVVLFFKSSPRIKWLNTKTYALWVVDPRTTRDTSTVVYRTENDSFSRRITNIDVENHDTTWKRMWHRDTFYFVPVTVRIDDTVKKTSRDTVMFRLIDNGYIIFDYDKHYK